VSGNCSKLHWNRQRFVAYLSHQAGQLRHRERAYLVQRLNSTAQQTMQKFWLCDAPTALIEAPKIVAIALAGAEQSWSRPEN
jgi:hypothetical protein